MRIAVSVQPDILKRNHIDSRPIDTTTEERVTPEDLRDKLAKSGQSSPQCLCPILNPDVSLVFQASIIRAEAGLHTGQLVVRCLSNQCGYVGERLDILNVGLENLLTVYIF